VPAVLPPPEIPPDAAEVVAAEAAIAAGDLPALRVVLDAHPGLAAARIGGGGTSRTLLHRATDWPGHLPNVADTIRLLVERGADPSARFAGPNAETPLHWAASADDVDAIDALVAAGAELEAEGAVLTGGTPMSDAVVFAQWAAARRLLEHGARTTVWQAAALGLRDEVARRLAEPGLAPEDVANACWHGCRSGSVEVVELLVAHGAPLDRIGHLDATPLDVAVRDGHVELVAWLRAQGAPTAAEVRGGGVHPRPGG